MAAIAALATAASNVIKNFFEINTISIDNWTFKLFYKWSTTIFVFGSICVTQEQYFGSPILCDAGHSTSGIKSDVLNTYCWMYSTYHLPSSYKGQCTSSGIGREGGEEERGDVYNSYYQWVPIYLMFLAVVFYVPRLLWMGMEGGLMKYFGKGTRSRYIEDKDQKRDRLITYFRKTVSNKYTVYFGGFIFCELLNILIVIGHFYITDLFLNKRYLTYGWDVAVFYALPTEEKKGPWVVNPFCHTFPRVASCNYFRYGAGGDQEKINAICILALNIINDKVFALTWWWGIFLSITSGCRLIYRMAMCSSPWLRFYIFNIRVYRYLLLHPKRDQIRAFIRSRPLGDWFVLHQLSKNLYRPFFMDFLIHLSKLESQEDVEGGKNEDTDLGDNVLTMMIKPTLITQESSMKED